MKSLCVYCGSASGKDGKYLTMARTLGEELAKREISLVYGGASIGLMGEVADTILAAGGQVTGVLPRNLFRREVPHHGLTELIEVDSMHERKARMADLADGFIALPGGLGTLESCSKFSPGHSWVCMPNLAEFLTSRATMICWTNF